MISVCLLTYAFTCDPPWISASWFGLYAVLSPEIIVGFFLIILAGGFYVFMLTAAPKSTDPVALMQTVGTVSGAVGGISVVMVLFGLIGRKV